MGIYLNSIEAYSMYKDEVQKPYFVDKTIMLKEICSLVKEGGNYICVTRPRRFGKSITANMIASFFSKGVVSSDIFTKLNIGKEQKCLKLMNQYPLIHISFNELPKKCCSYDQYITRIEERLIKDLKREYSNVEINEGDSLWDILADIYISNPQQKFVFVFDEWDYVFHQNFIKEQDKREYLLFLRNLLKNRSYVAMAYMTGILPIAKYSSGSELNMFAEYTMSSEERFAEYFGFTDEEVDVLYERYLQNDHWPKYISREDLREWYDGYYTLRGGRIYNPRSIVLALSNNNLGNYWTSSGPYDEIFYYIKHNIAEVRDELALMVAGEDVSAKIQEYAATSMNLQTKDEIFSAMVVYGFLTHLNGKVSIPNKELLGKFVDMLRKESSFGYIFRLAKESERMLNATLHGDTDTMTEILEFVHDTEVPMLHYNNETELAAIINLIYLAARDFYRVEREEKAGVGFVDFIFYPEKDLSGDCIILELKIDKSADEAITQIKDKKYALKFKGKVGERPKYTGKILAVGIGYDKKNKRHECKVEILK